MFSAITASVCRSQNTRQFLRSASVIFSRIAATAGMTPASSPMRQHQRAAEPQVASGQHEDGEQAAGRVAPLHDQPREPQAEAAAEHAR